MEGLRDSEARFALERSRPRCFGAEVLTSGHAPRDDPPLDDAPHSPG